MIHKFSYKIGNSCFLGIQIIIYLIVVFNFHRILSKNTLIKQNYIKSGKIRIIGLKSLLEHYNINRFDINQMNKLYRELEKYRDQHNALAKFKSLIKLVNPIGQIGAAFLGALIKNINETNLFIHFFCVALSAYTVLLALYLIIASLIETFGMNEYYNCDNLIEDLTQIELFDNRKY